MRGGGEVVERKVVLAGWIEGRKVDARAAKGDGGGGKKGRERGWEARLREKSEQKKGPLWKQKAV
jgi:hypothetical protein